MRLQSFEVYGVKSILDSGKCHLSETDNVTVLAGQNEAGKSGILEGLDYFRNGANEKFNKLSVRHDTKPVVTCTFTLDEEDKNHEDPSIKTILSGLDTVTTFRGAEDGGKQDKIYLSDEVHERISEIAEKLVVPTSQQPTTTEGEEPPVAAIAESAEQLTQRVTDLLTDYIPDFIFYDSFSDILPGEILISEIPNNKPVQDFEKIFGIKFSDALGYTAQQLSVFQRKINDKASLDLNGYWKQTQTTEEDDKYKFDVNINLAGDQSKVEFMIHRNDDSSLFMEQKSKGFQWFNAFNLRLKALDVDKEENYKTLIILIDEPGQGLHEAAQKDVKTVLDEIAINGAQIVYSTHNPSLIGVNDDEILRIRLVYQTREEGTKIKNLAQFSSAHGSKDALSPIITAMGANHVGQFLDETKTVIIVEGVTDHYYLNAMKKYLDISGDLAFIPACGATNAKTLIAILFGWRQTFKAILDEGSMGKGILRVLKKYLYKDNEDGLEKQIMVLGGFDGIEDLFSKNDFSTYVLKQAMPVGKKNSEIAKTNKKELLGRFFLESIDGEITLDNETKENFNKIFDWINNGTA